MSDFTEFNISYISISYIEIRGGTCAPVMIYSMQLCVEDEIIKKWFLPLQELWDSLVSNSYFLKIS